MLKVSLVEGIDQVIGPFDYDMAQILHKEIMGKGRRLYLSSRVTAITENSVKATKGAKTLEIPAGAVVLPIGVVPETVLAVKTSLEIGQSRYIKVNYNYQTSDPGIYTVGDSVELFSRMDLRYGNLTPASPAHREAQAADHICS